MKLLHLCCVAPPQGGGMGSVADSEVRRLRARGIEAWLAAPACKGIEAQEHVIRVPSYCFGNGAWMRGLSRLCSDADVVHLHYPFYGTAGQAAKLRRAGIIRHLVMTLHMDAEASGLRGLLFDAHRRWCQSRTLEAADQLLVSSLDYATHSSFSSFLTKHDPRLVELPFGVDTERFSPIADPFMKMEKWGFPSKAKVVGTVSVMDQAHPFKGIDVLLKAVARLPSDVHLLLVGDGDRRKDYENMAQGLGLVERVHFVGRLNNEDIVSALRSMDAFAFPSTSGAEAFGLAMLEAMACGVPVVASDLPGVRSVAQGAGLIVPPSDVNALSIALGSLLNDAAARKQYSVAARAKAVTYGWDAHIDRLLEIYKKLCASPS